MENSPGAGFSESVQDVRKLCTPRPSVAPGSHVSVGWSKLCHTTPGPDDDADVALLRTTRLPLSRSVATTVVVAGDEVVADAFDDHSKVFVAWTRSSPRSLSVKREADGSRIGRSRLATQTTVCLVTFLNQMPM
nr:unnamed protein product [Digitaria exilis]